MRTGSVALVCIMGLLCASGAAFNATAEEKPNVEELLLKAFKAEQETKHPGGNPAAFEEVLKADPENYYALIQLGLSKLKDVKRSGSERTAETEAIDYFLRAAIARPTNPEALLYLAQLYYDLGYVTEGDAFVKMASGSGKHVVYDAMCLEAKRHEETGNYHAAITAYSRPALSAGSRYRYDPFLLSRLYMSALLASPPYDWVYAVLTDLIGEEKARKEIENTRKVFLEILSQKPSLMQLRGKDTVELMSQMWLREDVLQALAAFVGYSGASSATPLAARGEDGGDVVPEKFELPTELYSLFFCSPKDIPGPPYTDAYEAFVKASADTEGEQDRLRMELESLRKEAARVVADETDEVEKAKKLFTWLKKRSLVTYNALEGYSARGVLDERKYQCLSGSILYMLLGRDAKLPINGVVEPGHAYALLDSGRNIRIETTTDGPEGFDFKPGTASRARDRDRLLQRSAYETYGEITDPLKFVVYQFVNATAFNWQALVLNKHEQLLRRVLRSDMGIDDEAVQTDLINRWRTNGVIGSKDATLFERLVRRMAMTDQGFRDELVKQIDDNIQFLVKARGLSPFNLSIKDVIYEYIMFGANLESLPAQSAMLLRDLQRRTLESFKQGRHSSLVIAAGFGSVEIRTAVVPNEAELDAALQRLDDEEAASWGNDKPAWMGSVARLAHAVRRSPCDRRLQASLARVYGQVMTIAERRNDPVAMEELRRMVAGAPGVTETSIR